jgi:hypothetical protein
MIEIRQAKDDLPGNRLLPLRRHKGGLLCRKYAQHFMRDAPQTRTELTITERKGITTLIEKPQLTDRAFILTKMKCAAQKSASHDRCLKNL